MYTLNYCGSKAYKQGVKSMALQLSAGHKRIPSHQMFPFTAKGRLYEI